MQTIEISAEVRSQVGKSAVARVRRAGKVPAVFYGPKRPVVLLSVDAKEFANKVMVLEGSHLIKFKSDAADLGGRIALVKDRQFHATSGAVVHADFYEVDLEAKLQVPVPLHFIGKAVGVVNGGILQPVRREIEVECLPMAIPEFVEVDVSALGIHDAVHVSQLKLPEGVDAVYETDFALVTVLPPSVAESKGEAGGEATAEAPAGKAAAPTAKAGAAKGGE